MLCVTVCTLVAQCLDYYCFLYLFICTSVYVCACVCTIVCTWMDIREKLMVIGSFQVLNLGDQVWRQEPLTTTPPIMFQNQEAKNLVTVLFLRSFGYLGCFTFLVGILVSMCHFLQKVSWDFNINCVESID